MKQVRVLALNIENMRHPKGSPRPPKKISIGKNDLAEAIGKAQQREFDPNTCCYMEYTCVRVLGDSSKAHTTPPPDLNNNNGGDMNSSSDNASILSQDSNGSESSQQIFSENSDLEGYAHELNAVGNYTKRNKEFEANFTLLEAGAPLKRQMALDAATFQELCSGSAYKTFLCVALRNVAGYVKKFIFYNMDRPMDPKVREAASRRNYMAIKGPQCHAEVQFYLDLMKRNHAGLAFTHLLGMGCSRKHCLECDAVLRVGFGEAYYNVSCVADLVADRVEAEEGLEEAEEGEEGEEDGEDGEDGEEKDKERDGFLVRRTQVFKRLYEREVVDPKCFDRFLLPAAIKSLLEEFLGYRVDFDGKYERKVCLY